VAYTAGFSVTVGNPTKASDVDVLAANDDYLKAAVDSALAYPLDMRIGASMRVTVASSGSPTVFSLGWWKSSDGRWWLLGNATSATSFSRSDAEFYIPTGDISDVPLT
jgi:hypothetical protein